MSTNRLRRTETPQRLATPVSTPTSGSNTTLPRPYGSHTVSIPCTRFPTLALRATAAAATVVVVIVVVGADDDDDDEDEDDGDDPLRPGQRERFDVTSSSLMLECIASVCRYIRSTIDTDYVRRDDARRLCVFMDARGRAR